MSSYILFPTNEYADSTKTEEEIKQLMMEDQSSLDKTMIYLITKGRPPQKPYVYKNFCQFFKQLLPYVVLFLPTEPHEDQIIAAESFTAYLQLSSMSRFSQEELDSSFKLCISMLNLWNWAVNQKWVKVLETLVDFYPNKTIVIQQLQKLILELGKANQPIVCKVTAGRLIAIISQYIGKKLKPAMVDILKSILNHPQSEARRIWVNELFPKLLKNIELTIIELHLQQKLFEAVYDKNEEVGVAALEIILKHSQYFSLEEQSSRVVKLFIDSIMAKNEKVCIMTSRVLGEVYQKLQQIILKNEDLCLRFWQSLIELSQCKNQTIVNNFVYNLPGILMLSKSRYNVEPISQVYIELFYDNLASKFQLAACFHEMVDIFQTKKLKFREIIYGMFEEVLEEDEECQEGFKVLNIIFENFDRISKIFMENAVDQTKDSYFEQNIAKYLLSYMVRIEKLRNSTNLQVFHINLKKYYQYFSSEQLQTKIIPKLYTALKLNLPFNGLIINNLVMCLSKQISNTNLLANYISKSLVELGRSNRSFERESGLRFFLASIDYLSIEFFQEFKLSEKIFFFSNDKNMKIRLILIQNLHRVQYYLNKQEKLEYNSVIARYHSDPDEQIRLFLNAHSNLYYQNLEEKRNFEVRSQAYRQNEKSKLVTAMPKRVLTRKDFYTYKELRAVKQEPKRKTLLLTEVNTTLPKIGQKRSTQKSRAKIVPLKVSNKRA